MSGRLDKWLSQSLGVSRSTARVLIRGGRVAVDGRPVHQADTRLEPGMQVSCDDQPLTPPQSRSGYWMMHKTLGYLSATYDDHQPTVIDLLPASMHAGIQVAGRLDKDSSGLLLLTTDGAWSHRLRRPGHHRKVYRLWLAEPVDAAMQQAWLRGVELRSDGCARALAVEVLGPCEVRMTIDEGRYHQVRRMCAAAGNHVLALHREEVAGIVLDAELQPGQWRALRAEEIARVDA